jgi:hypothetical protein
MNNSDLQDAIRRALASLDANPTGELSVGYRWLIYSCMGAQWIKPWQESDHRHGDYDEESDPTFGMMPPAQTTDGHQRRVRLAIDTVHHVLPIFEEAYPENCAPHLCLDTAQRIASGEMSYEEGWDLQYKLAGVWNEHGMGVRINGENHRAGEVLFAAGYAIIVALLDNEFDMDRLTDDAALKDDDAEGPEDPEDYDTAQWCMYAFACGKHGQTIVNKEKAQAFWHWWLTKAVPRAYDSVPTTDSGI